MLVDKFWGGYKWNRVAGGFMLFALLLLVLLGAWFLLSRVENLPKVNLERVIVWFSSFFNLLVWFELIDRVFHRLVRPMGRVGFGGN